MKKTFIILLASFYLIVISGLTVSLHYCGGKLKEISLFSSGNEDGCCGNKKKSKGCCKDKTTLIKVDDDHQSSHLLKVPIPSFKITIEQLPVYEYNFSSTHVIAIILNYHAPPVIYDNPLYLKHRVLLI